jgi:general secretion pathway protein D
MRKIILLIIIALTFWGCATFNRSYKLGTEAALSKNWDEAVRYYERALLESPKNSVYRLALFRAKLAASSFHLVKARELAFQGSKKEALVEYEKALYYDPLNRIIAEEAKSLIEEEVKEEEPKEIRIEPPVKLEVDKEKIELKFVDANLRSIFQALGKHARVNVLFDEQFRDITFSIDLVDMIFEQALSSLCLASKNFYRIIDERTIIIAPDLPQKRIQYELNAIKTFYLSNIRADEIRVSLTQMLRTQYKAPNIIVDKNINTVTVRDTPAVIELAEKIINLWDKPKGEIVLDIEIMEVSRIRLKQLGMELDQSLVGLRYTGPEGSGADDQGWFNLKGIDFSKSEHFQVTLPGAAVKFLEADSDTKIISQPRLRGIDGEEITYLVGDKIPIPRTTFTPIAAGGFAQQPLTSFEYQDVGIDVKITPTIHFEKEITLELEIKIKSLGGTGYANIPIIATREVKNVIRLKDGETNLLAGLLKDEERKNISGIAGLKNIPILGSLFSSTDLTIQQTDVIMTITPYIIRTVPVNEEDLEPLWVDLGGISPASSARGGPPEAALAEQRARRTAEVEDMARRRQQNQVFLTPANFEVPQNREFRVSVNARIQEDISSMSLNINFDPGTVTLKDVVRREFLNRLGKDVPFLKNIDNSSGVCTIGFSSTEVGKGIKGTGSVATLVFQAVGKGETTIQVTSVSANKPTGQTLTFETGQSRVVVR